MKIEIVFHPDGEGECLWTEALPLHAIGALKMRRASVVEFNEDRQEWEVWEAQRPDGQTAELLFANPSREACLQWEQQYFNQQLAQL